ncbi:MAG: hypothetical protein C5B49_05015 [Bdellovibrio sp.]|nr:MAG: hypothetical protein C5B49_05015 [Bdellovibrio sp.]
MEESPMGLHSRFCTRSAGLRRCRRHRLGISEGLSHSLLVLFTLLSPQLGFGAAPDVRVSLQRSPGEIHWRAKSWQIKDAASFARRGDKDTKFSLRWLNSDTVLTIASPGSKFSSRVELPLEVTTDNGEAGEVGFLPPRVVIRFHEGTFQMIGLMSLNDYLLGVLTKEMSDRWPVEALKAQAVAARSYTLAQIEKRSAEDFDVEASIMDQEFAWVRDRSSESAQRWWQMIQETEGQVLKSPEGKVFKAYYHSDCGGQTTTPETVWGAADHYDAVSDSVCSERTSNSWRVTLAKGNIARLLGISLNSLKPAPPQTKLGFQFDWVRSPFDERVTLVEWRLSPEEGQLLTGQNFRQMIGFQKIKSTRFHAQDLGDRILFVGRGFGHGVGLCQWGSRDWALRGWTAEQILHHYYPQAQLIRLAVEQEPKSLACDPGDSRRPSSLPRCGKNLPTPGVPVSRVSNRIMPIRR